MRGILFSVALHTLVVLAVVLGLPWLAKPPANAARTIAVDIVRLSDITRVSKGEKPKPKTERKPDAERDTARKPVARDRRAEKPPVEPEPVKPKPPAPVPPKTAEPKPKPTPKPTPKPAPQKKPEIAVRKAAPPAPPKPAKIAKPAPKPEAATPKRVDIDPRALQRQAEKPKLKAPAKKPEIPAAKPAGKPQKKPETRVARPAPKPEKKKVLPKKPVAPVAKPKKIPAPKPLETAKKAAPKPNKKPERKPPETVKKVEPNIDREIAALPRLRRPAKPRPKKAAAAPKKTVKKRPTEENPLDSVFKAVGKLKKSAPKQSERNRASDRTAAGAKTAAHNRPMTLSEIDAVRQQIQPCWNFPVGAQDAGSLRVLIRIWLNRDGSVRDAKVLDRARLAGDSKLRAAADAGIRAVKNPRCSPLRLPPEKFDQWKVLTIDFDPSKLSSG